MMSLKEVDKALRGCILEGVNRGAYESIDFDFDCMGVDKILNVDFDGERKEIMLKVVV